MTDTAKPLSRYRACNNCVMQPIFLVLDITEWANVSAQVFGSSFPINIPQSGDAFAPVYYDYSAARRDYPNSKIIEIGITREQKDEQA